MKKVLTVALISLAVALYSCGGHSSNSESNSGPVSNAEAPSATMSNAAPAIDINAKSDSKGVGKFKDVKIGKLDAALAEKGKTLFQSKCTACHMSTDEKLIGPGLKGITNIRTPEWILNMITNPTDMTAQDPVAKELLNQFHTQMTFQNVTDDDARAILEFLRQNDGAQ